MEKEFSTQHKKTGINQNKSLFNTFHSWCEYGEDRFQSTFIEYWQINS